MSHFSPKGLISTNLEEVHLVMLPNIKGLGLVALTIIEQSLFQDFYHLKALGIKVDLAIN